MMNSREVMARLSLEFGNARSHAPALVDEIVLKRALSRKLMFSLISKMKPNVYRSASTTGVDRQRNDQNCSFSIPMQNLCPG